MSDIPKAPSMPERNHAIEDLFAKAARFRTHPNHPGDAAVQALALAIQEGLVWHFPDGHLTITEEAIANGFADLVDVIRTMLDAITHPTTIKGYNALNEVVFELTSHEEENINMDEVIQRHIKSCDFYVVYYGGNCPMTLIRTEGPARGAAVLEVPFYKLRGASPRALRKILSISENRIPPTSTIH